MEFFSKDSDLNRREFIRRLGMAGLGFSLPWPFIEPLYADYDPSGNPDITLNRPTEPLWVFIHAAGGWDPTSFCDPKGRDTRSDNRGSSFAGSINSFSTRQTISSSGATGNGYSNTISFAPDPFVSTANYNFFNSNANNIRVVNGIDTTTNNHAVGPIFIYSGKISQGHPNLASIIAATHGSTMPLGYINNGGYSYTDGITAATQLNDVGSIEELAKPNKVRNRDYNYFTEHTRKRIEAFRDERLQERIGSQYLPRLKQAMKGLKTARDGEAALRNFTAFTDQLEADVDTVNGGGTVSGISSEFATAYSGRTLPVKAFAIAHAAYLAGLTQSVNLRIGGFDSHSNHDNATQTRVNRIADTMRLIVDHAGINNVMIVVGSDFGRTPWYNGGNGKDHWPITSMFFMGGKISSVGGGGGGGGVTGGSDYDYKVDVEGNKSGFGATESSDAAGAGSPQSDGGSGPRLKIKPSHVHYSLRKLAGVENSNVKNGLTVKNAYPLIPDEEYMKIFGNV